MHCYEHVHAEHKHST